MEAYDLRRFEAAQEPVMDAVLAELRAGRKRTHWMWFVFPQLRGLGQSAMAVRYGIGSMPEAEAYLAHPVLGARLCLCTRVVCGVEERSALEIFGSPDDRKFWSCLTLFSRVGGSDAVFGVGLGRFFGG